MGNQLSIFVLLFLVEAVTMRRQDNAMFSGHGDNVSSVYSSNQKADKMANTLDNTVVDCNEFLDIDACGDFLPENLTLHPKLDSIFADVATKLPSIDLDMSDVSYVDYSLYYFRINYWYVLQSSNSLRIFTLVFVSVFLSVGFLKQSCLDFHEI